MDEEEEEFQAALMARRAQLAELKAAEKQYLTSTGALTAAPAAPATFLSKAEREKLQQTQPPPVPRLPTKRPATAPAPAPVARSEPKRANFSNTRNSRRFKFEWDETDDTSHDYYSVPSSSSLLEQDARLLQLVDKRQQQQHTVQETIDVNDKPLDEMTDRDWRIIRENFDIHINRVDHIPHPARRWQEMHLSPQLMHTIIDECKYVAPTPIQMQAIPIGISLTTLDMIGQAETGSGKTAAFVIPMLVRLEREPWVHLRKTCDQNGPLGLILAPTRELVHQINDEILKFSSLCRTCAVVGGNSAEDQAFLLQRGVDVIVATPGRLLDLLSSRTCVLNHCSFVVMDEADRMIDMGFESQVNKVLDSLVVGKQQRTMFMFSATMDQSVIRLAQHYMKASPIIVRIGDEESGKNKNIDQHVQVFTSEASKEQALMRLLTSAESEGPIIVFCNSKANCDLLVRAIKQRGIAKRACALHSGRNQEEREDNLHKFKDGYYQVLVATDVAGRGLDVENVSHVINFECPSTLQRYTHRIGRTGRAGKWGKATTFVTRGVDDPQVLLQIQKYLKQTGHAVPRDLLDAIGDGGGAQGGNIQD